MCTAAAARYRCGTHLDRSCGRPMPCLAARRARSSAISSDLPLRSRPFQLDPRPICLAPTPPINSPPCRASLSALPAHPGQVPAPLLSAATPFLIISFFFFFFLFHRPWEKSGRFRIDTSVEILQCGGSVWRQFTFAGFFLAGRLRRRHHSTQRVSANPTVGAPSRCDAIPPRSPKADSASSTAPGKIRVRGGIRTGISRETSARTRENARAEEGVGRRGGFTRERREDGRFPRENPPGIGRDTADKGSPCRRPRGARGRKGRFSVA